MAEMQILHGAKICPAADILEKLSLPLLLSKLGIAVLIGGLAIFFVSENASDNQ